MSGVQFKPDYYDYQRFKEKSIISQSQNNSWTELGERNFIRVILRSWSSVIVLHVEILFSPGTKPTLECPESFWGLLNLIMP